MTRLCLRQSHVGCFSANRRGSRNIETIVRALARLKYRNVALLQLIADHVKRRSDQPRACYALLKALIDLKYVDRNVAQMASDFVCATAPFMHVNEIPELLGVLLAIHTQLPIDSSIYQAVTRVVSRNQEHADWKVVFGVKAALETVNMRDTYLDEMCKRLSVQCCTDLSTESKIELLRSCKNYPLPLVCLYDAVLSSFQKAGSGKEHAVCILAAPVNTKAFMDLISVFSDLGYVKGLCACLATIGLNATSIEGELAIKYQELLMRHFDYQDLLLAYEKTNAEVEYVEKLRARTEPAQSDASMKAEAESSADRLAIRPIQAASSAMTKHFERYLSGETLATLMDSWKRLDHICTNASPLECALGICRATSTKYVCRLVSRIIGAPCDALEPEIIPAVLRRTLTISQVEGRTPETIIKLHAHLLGLLTHRPSIQNLSMKACTSLISVLESIEHPCVEKVLPLMVECYVDRMNSSEDIMDVRRCCNESISLMGICIKRKAVDARRLAACICLHARHVELDRVQQLLSLLVELGFVKNKYTNLLEPLVEKAITLDSDMSRVLQLEEYGKHLGFVFTQEIKNEV
ncbi:poly(A) RNA polymerase protein 1 [Babesia caballi]|uniref:Poly(A) RNA polymerase protein 1 n=1 Tax=Babesia caballi TaxID=5871 RepID=A0AAV4LS90_BABCB|nr:poly(A) RNA polymerase protein 1 [Babesia caballi]